MIKSFPLYKDPLFWITLLLSFFLITLSASAKPGEGTLVSGQVRINNTEIPNAVVYLLPEDNKTPPVTPMERTIVQEALQFSPAFSIVTMGSTLYFENRDDKIHNVRSNSPSNRFDSGPHLPNAIKK